MTQLRPIGLVEAHAALGAGVPQLVSESGIHAPSAELLRAVLTEGRTASRAPKQPEADREQGQAKHEAELHCVQQVLRPRLAWMRLRPSNDARNGNRHADAPGILLRPLHSERAAAAVIESSGSLGKLMEFRLMSLTAPRVTHHWTNLESFTDEVANARIGAGFH
jgi:hypothetical protein